MKKILIYGYGNPGRQDDGLGAQFIEHLDQWINIQKLNFIDLDCNYQLNVEDAAQIHAYDTVIFVDASVDERVQDFLFEPLEINQQTMSFTTHAASPGYVAYLCKQMFQHAPQCYLLHIKGYTFDFAEGLSPQAQENLQKAFNFLTEWIEQQYL